jgi:hypothetical protein
MPAEAEVSQRLPSLQCPGNGVPLTAEEQNLHKIQLQRLAEAIIKYRHSGPTEDELRAQVLLLLFCGVFPQLASLIPWCGLFLGTADCGSFSTMKKTYL